MIDKITKTLISDIEKKVKPPKVYEIYDTDLPGFLIRIQPSGSIAFIVSYRFKGKRNRITIGQSNKISAVQARDKADKILASLTLGGDPAQYKASKEIPTKKMTLDSFIDRQYQRWCEVKNKDGVATIKRIKSAFADLLDEELEEINEYRCETWRTNRQCSDIANSTINRDITALKSLISTAVDWGFLQINSLAKFKLLEIDSSPKVRYLDKNEEIRLLDALYAREREMDQARERSNAWREQRGYPLFPPVSDHLRRMVIISLNTGVRWGELAQLTWDNVDLEQTQQLTITGVTSKKKKTRYIPLNVIALQTLKEWKKVTGELSKGLVFPGEKGNVLDNVNKSWAGVKDRAQITDFRWHDLRHSFASKLVMNGVDLNTVRELLGHADLKMTLRYAHLAPEHKAKAVAMLL